MTMAAKPVILIVDDQPLNIELLEAHLVPEGYDTLKAEDGEAALKIIAENTVDLVLLDVMMPKIDGFEVCRRIKADERLRNIPVVMITALAAKEDRIKGIEAGAEDFISKPIDRGEVLARVRMLLKMKALNDRLLHAYEEINAMTNFGEASILAFDPLKYSFLTKVDDIVRQVISNATHAVDKPKFVIVGVPDERQAWQWYQYQSVSNTLSRRLVAVDIERDQGATAKSRVFFYNRNDQDQPEFKSLARTLASMSVAVSNMACFLSDALCIMAVNYGRDVTPYDAAVLNSFVMQSLFMKSLSGQIRETESAFEYTVYALARASEANDEDTGNHILRVGDYSALIAAGLGMPADFVEALRVQATLHDVGKIHIHPDILKKPAKLTREEWLEMKKHTVHGQRIIGNHQRLHMANKIAAAHHERWDGSGYPLGLKGDLIPIEGRILNIADQYDALRNKRSYKLALDHLTAYMILSEGDGRTLPQHFDPDVLRMFKKVHARFEEIYQSRKD
jgi:response regulator RpfG family c-di-GMP phosphodiesterase